MKIFETSGVVFILTFTLICVISAELVYLNKCVGFSSISSLTNNILRVPAHLVFSKENVTFGLREATKPLQSSCNSYNIEEFTLQMAETADLAKDKTTKLDSNVMPVLNSTNITNTETEDYYVEEEPPPIKKYFTKNGLLRIDRNYYRPSEFCISRIHEPVGVGSLVLEVCHPKCNDTAKYAPCIRKCCSIGTALNVLTPSCTPIGEKDWTPFFYRDPYTITKEAEQLKFQPHLSQSPPSCEFEQHALSNRNLPNETKHPWRILLDGSIWYLAGNRKWTKLATDNYCIDGILNFGEGEFYSGLPSDQMLLVCPEEQNNTAGKYSPLYVTVMLISTLFLLLTATVYVLLWERQNNIHTWTVLAQVISMFFMYIFLATANIMSFTITAESSGLFCRLVGVLAHFFFLSTFCWLTMINFDLCWTFRALSPGIGQSKGLRRFLCYCAFAFTVPVSVITTGLVLEHLYADDLESEILTPLYGQITCYIAVWSQGVYVYYIVGTLISANFILIVITALTIYKLRQSTKVVANNRTNSQHQSFKLFAKLFVIMGVTWVFEIISWSSVQYTDKDQSPWYWVIFDLINILQAVAIFIVFVCKPRTLNQLQQKFPCLKHVFTPVVALCNTQQQNQTPGSSREGDVEHHTTGSTVQSASKTNSKRNSETNL